MFTINVLSVQPRQTVLFLYSPVFHYFVHPVFPHHCPSIHIHLISSNIFLTPLILLKSTAAKFSVIFRNDVNCHCYSTLAFAILKPSNQKSRYTPPKRRKVTIYRQQKIVLWSSLSFGVRREFKQFVDCYCPITPFQSNQIF